MQHEYSLLEFLLQRYANLTEEELTKHDEFEQDSDSFKVFLRESIIGGNLTTKEIDRAGLDALKQRALHSTTYPELIDHIVRYFLDSRKPNALVNGFSDPSRPGGKQTSNSFSNFQVDHLKSETWARLCSRLGKDRFLELIATTSCYCRQGPSRTYVTIFGHKPFVGKKNMNTLSKRSMLYKGTCWKDTIRLLTQDVETLATNITGENVFENKSIPKKYRKLVKLLERAKSNDERINYVQIFNHMVPTLRTEQTIIGQSTPMHVVVRFMLTVIFKVFPSYSFGCDVNKTQLNRKLVEFLKAHRSDGVLITSMVAGFNITSISWLGKSPQITSVSDKLLRESIFTKFILWMFGRFVTMSIRMFWYVTENSQASKEYPFDTAYFPHKVWRHLTKAWADQYVAQYLFQVQEPNSQPSLRYNFGTLRLVPKKSDFRPLCIPLKREDHVVVDYSRKERLRQRHEYMEYDRDTIRPIRDILRRQQQKRYLELSRSHPRCYSVRDVARGITTFKKDLLMKHNQTLPQLYGIKFDMKHCYDNLNQGKIIESLNSLFHGEEDGETYFVRRFTEHGDLISAFAKMRCLIKNTNNVEELNMMKYAPKAKKVCQVITDLSRTVKFTKSEILDLVKDQVLHSTIEIPERGYKQYTRKRGVFQGFPLLATFCDIVYNSLVDELFDFLLDKSQSHSSILLRLADDFLFISDNQDQCKVVYDIATSKAAHEYGAYVNLEKCSWINFEDHEETTLMKFVGLEVDIGTLQILKTIETPVRLSVKNSKSFAAAYNHLEWSFDVRLSDYLLDTSVANEEGVLDNIHNALTSILRCVTERFQDLRSRSEFDEGEFKIFLVTLLFQLLKKFSTVNGDLSMMVQIIENFKRTTVLTLQLLSMRIESDMMTWLKYL